MKKFLLICCLFGMFASDAFAGCSATLLKDAYVRENAPNTMHGNVPSYKVNLHVSSTGGGNSKSWTLVEFDSATIEPTGDLVLEFFGSPGLNLNSVKIYKITGSWTETGVTWNNMPAIGTTQVGTYLGGLRWKVSDRGGKYMVKVTTNAGFQGVSSKEGGNGPTLRVEHKSGDSNKDGAFNSVDLVSVFTAGKYETGLAATWAEGDWNCDGVFNSADFVVAFQAGHYVGGNAAAAAYWASL